MTVLGSVAAVSVGLSCAPLPDTCEELGTCAAPDAAAAAPQCNPTMDPKDDPCVLDNADGVFVASAAELDGASPSSEAGIAAEDGTAQHPFATIAQGLANLGRKSRLYVCNGAYREPVRITTAVSVYGGLSCASGPTGRIWSYVGQSAQVTSPSPAYALAVADVDSGSVTIEDMSFASPDATELGSSSLAALIASSTVDLRRVTLSAGNGANGADGIVTPNYTGSAPDGGSQALPVDLPFMPAGGAGAVNQCTGFGVSVGGQGGAGCLSGPGSPGLGTPGSATPVAPTVLAGRDGQARGAALADAGTVAANDPGADGVGGDGGLPAAAQAYGVLSPSGWVPSAGGDGDPGGPGQGGAGATDPIYGMCGTSTHSLGGGGGGAGGCGGSGGQGGGGGGASVALAVVASTVELTTCTLVAAAGGTGGAGSSGQDGQAGGAGGDVNSLSAHAAGAPGGNGAGGSGGAGGTGGISVDILESGSRVASDMATTQSAKLGAPGAGGTAGMAGRHGAQAGLATGMDGHSGVSGMPGTSAFLLETM